MAPSPTRRLSMGAEPTRSGVHFRVWAPKRKRVEVLIGDRGAELTAETKGYFSGLVDTARVGDRYRFRLDGGTSVPDPASRYQPDGPHGDSQVVDPFAFSWTDGGWRGPERARNVVYEMHVGTFTPVGTFAAAAAELEELAGLGITLIEMMPVAEFPGRFGWGYDGVDLFAPYHGYGSCDDLRAFVDRAHELGVGVILDVVYNHFGPDGNYLRELSDSHFNHDRVTDWGDAINYDGHDCHGPRDLVLANVRHWVEEYHLDGLRLDATDNIYDESEPHLIAEICRLARATARSAGRRIVILAESEAQNVRLLDGPETGGFGVDMVWNDDFQHSAFVAATGRREAYYTDYRGTAQEIVSAIKHGFLYQGQRYAWQKNPRGTAVWHIDRHRFIHYLENHDQVANSRDGRRLYQLTSAARYRALAAVMLLGPETPLLFQGQEFGASSPFLFFADHDPELARLVREGRAWFLAQFPSTAGAALDDPADPRTFERSRLDLSQRDTHPEQYAFHRDLISLRQCDPTLAADDTRVDGAVVGEGVFVLRFFAADGGDRLLFVNLGPDFAPDVVPEPLLSPTRRGECWRRLWYSEDPCYGGRGAPEPESEEGIWRIPAESATVLACDQ